MPDPTAKIESMVVFFMSDVSVLACLVLMVPSFLSTAVVADRTMVIHTPQNGKKD